jgi:hypothetical protein
VDVALWIGGLCSLVTTILLNAHDAQNRAVQGPQNLALTAVCLVPLALAAGALTGRRVLLLPAAIAAIAVGPVLWSGLPLLWIPGIAYAIAFARMRRIPLPRWWRTILAVVVPVALTVTALVLLFNDATQRCGHTANSSLCAGGPPDANVRLSIGCSALAVICGWVLARPQAKGEISPRNPQVVGLVPHRQPQAK